MPRAQVSYWLLRVWARVAVAVMYRRVDVSGSLPSCGAMILAANHSNALADIAVIVSKTPRFPHFLAAASWWRWAPARLVLRLGGVVAIYRARDGNVRRNLQAFATCHDALASGATIVIFPEGEVEVEVDPVLLPLGNGAARIALGAVATAGLTDVVIVPVGVAYEQRGTFRPDVEMHLAEPIAIDDWVARYRDEPAKTVRAVTDMLAERLADAAIRTDAERLRDARLVERAAALTLAEYGDATFVQRNALRRALTRGLSATGATTASAYRQLDDAVTTAMQDLARLGIHDPATSLVESSRRRSRRARLTAELVVLAPVAALGAAANAPIVVGVVAVSAAVQHEVWRDTTRGLAGSVLGPLVWIAELGLLGRRLGPWRASVVVAAGALSGLASLAWCDRWRSRRRILRCDRLARNDTVGLEQARASRGAVASRVRALVRNAAPGPDASGN